MILVADRCGLSPVCLDEMKESIMGAVSEFVEIDSDDEIEINMTQDDATGLIYSVAVPVRRVKPDKRGEEAMLGQATNAMAGAMAASGGGAPATAAAAGGAGGDPYEDGGFDDEGEWDEDPAARFPYGT